MRLNGEGGVGRGEGREGIGELIGEGREGRGKGDKGAGRGWWGSEGRRKQSVVPVSV